VKLALAGASTRLVDVNQAAVDRVNSGRFPFIEKGGDDQLKLALAMDLKATTSAEACAAADVIIFVTGTPVDEHLNEAPKCCASRLYAPYFRPASSS
jgi:UDP-N-acetyl-D-mannosaminuronic acid dehydrogenase